jgi:hypothetical protein
MIVVYDIEALSNLFTVTFYEIKNDKYRQFVIHESQNDLAELVKYVKGLTGMIGYNNVNYDYKVIHPFITEPDYKLSGEKLAREIYKRSTGIIEERIRDWVEPIVPQRDLFLVHHFNSKAKRVSLKFLQINMGMENVQEMPFHHTQKIETSQIKLILDYNKNDVIATYHFYKLSADRLKLRQFLSQKYTKDFGNFSDVKIGEQIFLKELSKKTGIPEKVIEKGKTKRLNIYVKDCMLEVQFQSKEFKSVYEHYQKIVINENNKPESIAVNFDGVNYEFGFGGIHACRGAGIYHNIRSADVSSYYPNLAIGQRFYPQHLGEVFCDVYNNLYLERKKYPKSSPESAAYKLALNGTFGQTNSEWSFLYDPAFMVKITINGQLLLAKLCEDITLSGSGRVIMANTDGIEIDVKNESKFKEVCDAWQKTYNLELEFANYKKIAIRDANAYLGIKSNGEVKAKNDFETKKEIYKDQSMMIVPVAVREFFVNGVPPEITINSCDKIAMFILGKRSHSGTMEYRAHDDGNVKITPLSKYVRYYVSKHGGTIVKKLEEKIVNVHVGRRMTIFNKWVNTDFDNYQVDKSFYIAEAYKLINSVVNYQTTLI